MGKKARIFSIKKYSQGKQKYIGDKNINKRDNLSNSCKTKVFFHY